MKHGVELELELLLLAISIYTLFVFCLFLFCFQCERYYVLLHRRQRRWAVALLVCLLCK